MKKVKLNPNWVRRAGYYYFSASHLLAAYTYRVYRSPSYQLISVGVRFTRGKR